MKKFKSYIIEALKINSKSKVNKTTNENVLILETDKDKHYTVDKDLFITGLEKFNKDYPNSDLVFCSNDSKEKYFYNLYNKHGYKPDNINFNTINSIVDFIILATYERKPDIIINEDNSLQKILNTLNKTYKKYKYLKLETFTIRNEFKYLYIWHSDKENYIRFEYSNIEYKKLLKENYFN